MATRASDTGSTVVSITKQPISGKGFDRAMMITSGWLLAGGYLDAWAHNNIPRLETFFTPWHGVLYSGFLIVASVLVGTVLINHNRGYSWRQAIPAGYELSVLAVAGFIVGGIGDMCWHILFGIEKNIDAALSPTHLLLATCIGLLVAGPYRALYRQQGQMGSERGPLILALATLLVLLPFTLITQIANPFSSFWPIIVNMGDNVQLLAVVSIIFQTTILMGLILITMRRWQLPVGFFTIVYTLNALLLSFMQGNYSILLMTFLAGIISDIVYRWLRPTQARLIELRIFAFLAPAILFSIYILVLQITYGIVWTIHFAGGSIVIAGITGWLLSYILFLPQSSSSE